MAIAVDASTPVRWSGTSPFPTPITSASFAAPTDALLVLCVNWDTTSSSPIDIGTPTDTGGLTWSNQVSRTGGEATAGGASGIWTARTTSSVSRTVSVAYASSGAGDGSERLSAKLYVLTGVDVDGTPVDTVGASNEGGSATNNLTTTSMTAGANGLLVAVGTDWNALGAPTSSDLTADAAHYASQLSVISGYKSVTNGASVNANLDAAAGTPQWKWCQIIVREAAGGGGATPAALSTLTMLGVQ